MTAGERELWRSVYAASWHVSGWRAAPGPVSDEERARWSARQADRAIEALRAIGNEGNAATEVLR